LDDLFDQIVEPAMTDDGGCWGAAYRLVSAMMARSSHEDVI